MRLFLNFISMLLITISSYVIGSDFDGMFVDTHETVSLMAGCSQYKGDGMVTQTVCTSCQGSRSEPIVENATMNGKDSEDRKCKTGSTCTFEKLSSDGCHGGA
ncbi:MAG: hypothetical protein LBE12_17725 [Planctomycetaceae bacterium]|jgi:hypothetical protein|nr:hypothetical protein [Planctomycetaceae bacterium]